MPLFMLLFFQAALSSAPGGRTAFFSVTVRGSWPMREQLTVIASS